MQSGSSKLHAFGKFSASTSSFAVMVLIDEKSILTWFASVYGMTKRDKSSSRRTVRFKISKVCPMFWRHCIRLRGNCQWKPSLICRRIGARLSVNRSRWICLWSRQRSPKWLRCTSTLGKKVWKRVCTTCGHALRQTRLSLRFRQNISAFVRQNTPMFRPPSKRNPSDQ